MSVDRDDRAIAETLAEVVENYPDYADQGRRGREWVHERCTERRIPEGLDRVLGRAGG